MTGSTYTINRWEDLLAENVAPWVFGIQATANLNSQTIIDTKITDDAFVRGIDFMANGQIFNDKATLQIIDKDAVYYPANTVLLQPAKDFNIPMTADALSCFDAVVPKKILGGLYVRVIYTSVGLIANVGLQLNLRLLKCLV